MSSWLTVRVRYAVALLVLCSPTGTLAEAQAGGIERQGVVHAVDYGTNTLVISGTRYTVALDANVEVAGSYGAFTMLKEGMNVDFSFDLYDDQTRVITQISEMPAGRVVQEY